MGWFHDRIVQHSKFLTEWIPAPWEHFLWKRPILNPRWTCQWAGWVLSSLSGFPFLSVSPSFPRKCFESITCTLYPRVVFSLSFFAFDLACKIGGYSWVAQPFADMPVALTGWNLSLSNGHCWLSPCFGLIEFCISGKLIWKPHFCTDTAWTSKSLLFVQVEVRKLFGHWGWRWFAQMSEWAGKHVLNVSIPTRCHRNIV